MPFVHLSHNKISIFSNKDTIDKEFDDLDVLNDIMESGVTYLSPVKEVPKGSVDSDNQ